MQRLTLAVFLVFTSYIPLQGQENPRYWAKEDFIATYEPTHSGYYGIQWGINNFLLPFRILQRGKKELELRFTNNWNFGSEGGGLGGILLRSFIGTGAEFGLLMGPQNLHHVMGHDAAAREISKDCPTCPQAAARYNQILPSFLGGETLENWERPTPGGSDYSTRYMVLPMEAENHFAFAQGKVILSKTSVNPHEALDFIFYRIRFLMDYSERGNLTQSFVDLNGNIPSSQGKTDQSSDYTHYLTRLNKGRYGVSRDKDFRLKMQDLMKAHAYQALDPLFLLSMYRYGKDYIGAGRTRTHVPMLSLSENVRYLPSFRIYFSPFGLEYFQDNYFRVKDVLVNVHGAVGDNQYEKRWGTGVEVENIRIKKHFILGLFAHFHRQPELNRLVLLPALSPSQYESHNVYNAGASLKIPVLFLTKSPDPARVFLYGRAGAKTHGWVPGEYLGSSGYAQAGLGLHL